MAIDAAAEGSSPSPSRSRATSFSLFSITQTNKIAAPSSTSAWRRRSPVTRSARYAFEFLSQAKNKGKSRAASSIALSFPTSDCFDVFLPQGTIEESRLFARRLRPSLGRFWPIRALLRAVADLACVLAQLEGDCDAPDPLARGGSMRSNVPLAAAALRGRSTSFFFSHLLFLPFLPPSLPPTTPPPHIRNGRVTSSRSWAGRTSRASR